MGMSYQEQKARQGVPAWAIFGLSLLFVFLVLAALYESWSLPWSVLLSTPVAVFGALFALWLRRVVLGWFLPPYMVQMENDVYTQIGLVMLIGLGAKNSILIVAFAKEEYERGRPLVEAALDGARLRFRPLMMTALAFIVGCVPLWTASGAGAIARQIIGTTVIGGMVADLIHTALQQNYDVRIAATRVLEAQAQLGITRANQLPSASVGASIYSQQYAKISNVFPPFGVNAGQLNLSVIWNLDFWGKYRRQTEAARAQMLASEWGQRAVISSLVANVATAYFQLRALDAEIEIAKRTLGSRQQSLQLTRVLETHGSASDLDVSQSEQLVYTASEMIPDLERQI